MFTEGGGAHAIAGRADSGVGAARVQGVSVGSSGLGEVDPPEEGRRN